MINCNENENGNGKIDHINEKDMNRPRRRHKRDKYAKCNLSW